MVDLFDPLGLVDETGKTRLKREVDHPNRCDGRLQIDGPFDCSLRINDAEVNVEQDDLGEEIGRQAARLGRSPEELAEFMLQPERIGALFSDAFRRKTIDHILEQVQVLSGPPEDAAAAGGDDEPAPASDDDANDVDDGATAEPDEADPS